MEDVNIRINKGLAKAAAKSVEDVQAHFKKKQDISFVQQMLEKDHDLVTRIRDRGFRSQVYDFYNNEGEDSAPRNLVAFANYRLPQWGQLNANDIAYRDIKPIFTIGYEATKPATRKEVFDFVMPGGIGAVLVVQGADAGAQFGSAALGALLSLIGAFGIGRTAYSLGRKITREADWRTIQQGALGKDLGRLLNSAPAVDELVRDNYEAADKKHYKSLQ